MKLQEIDKNGTLQGFVLVKSCERKTSKNGSTYLDLIICDGESDTSAKVWSYTGSLNDIPQPNSIILIRGTLGSYNGQAQFKIDRFRASTPQDNVDISSFVPSAGFPEEKCIMRLLKLSALFRIVNLHRLHQQFSMNTKMS